MNIFAIDETTEPMVCEASSHDQVEHPMWRQDSLTQYFVLKLTPSEFSTDPFGSVPLEGKKKRLRARAERADARQESGLQLRRQAAYLAGFDPAPDTSAWLDHLPKP